jgi:hypothetical protein
MGEIVPDTLISFSGGETQGFCHNYSKNHAARARFRFLLVHTLTWRKFARTGIFRQRVKLYRREDWQNKNLNVGRKFARAVFFAETSGGA